MSREEVRQWRFAGPRQTQRIDRLEQAGRNLQVEQIAIFRSMVIEELDRNVNGWLNRNDDKEVVDISMVYEPPRPLRSTNEVPDQEAWVVLLRYRTNGEG